MSTMGTVIFHDGFKLTDVVGEKVRYETEEQFLDPE